MGGRDKVAGDEVENGPVAKRARRSRAIVGEDEDEETPNEGTTEESTTPKNGLISNGSDVAPQVAPTHSAVQDSEAVISEKKEDLSENEDGRSSSAEASGAEEEHEAGAEMDEKPEVAAMARQKVQTRLLANTKDPYPDWKPGTAVPYAALCKTFSLVEMTAKRLVIMEYCSLFLRQVMRLTPEDLLPTVLLMVNKLAPDYAGIELGIGESLIMKAIGETTGRSLQVIKMDQKEIGDLGLVAVKSRSTQPTMFKPKPLTVAGVHKGLMSIATVAGNGAQGRKVDGIKKLLSAADAHATGKVDITKDKGGPSEAKYIVRFLEGKLRLGLAEKTVLVSLAQAVVFHEADQRGKIPSTTDMERGESILKTVYR